MGKLDKNQKMLVVILGMFAFGMFGFFTYRMIKPTPAAARTQVASVALKTVGRKIADLKPAPLPSDIFAAPVPSSGMRDPFIPGITDPGAMQAYITTAAKAKTPPSAVPVKSGAWNRPAPRAAALPDMHGHGGGFSVPTADAGPLTAAPIGKQDGLPPATAAPDASGWTLTGVVQTSDGEIAILRNGDQRRMVRRGEMVDNTFRIADLSRAGVTLAHGGDRHRIRLGGTSAAPKPAAASTGPETPSVAPTTQEPSTPQELGAPGEPATGLPAGTVTPGGTEVDPNALLKLPGGLKLPTINIPN